MTEQQIICLLFAAPFLALAIGFVVGLAAIEYHERRNIRRLKAILREGMK